MIKVALAAVAIYLGLIAWRMVSYNSLAQYHEEHLNSGKSFLYDSTNLRNWHEKMRRKYEFAASHPWLAAEPGPPPPD